MPTSFCSSIQWSSICIERIKASAQLGIVQSFLGDDLGKAGTQEPIIGAGAEQGGSTTLSVTR